MRQSPKKRTQLIPNSTPVPNVIFDVMLGDPGTSKFTIAVLLYLIRCTIGYQKLTAFLSLADIQKGAGVSKNSARAAINEILERGMFQKLETGTTKGKKSKYAFQPDFADGEGRDPLEDLETPGASVSNEEGPDDLFRYPEDGDCING